MSSSALKLLQGRVVDGRYLLDEWIGGGSFGGVFLAGEYVDDRRLRTVAVKLLPAEPGDAGEAQRRELEVSLNLDHPHLLRCFSAGRCGVEGFDVLYLTMKVAEGSLEARLQESRLSESETRELALSLASALAHLHAKNLVHRDVKPGNVLRVGDAWKLADFGSVRAVEKSTAQASKNIGTASYAPPEAYEGSVSSAWDVWSLGCLLQEAATGELPFEADTPTALMHRVLTGDPAIPADLPAWLDALVRACLNKERSQRPAAKDVSKMLDARPAPLVGAQSSVSKEPPAPETDSDPSNLKLLHALHAHSGGVTYVAFLPDGRTLLSGGRDHIVRIWDAGTGDELRSMGGYSGWGWAVSLSPDGRTIACGASDDKAVRLWEIATGKAPLALYGHGGSITALAFSPRVRTVASGSDDRTIRLWDADSGRHLGTLLGHGGCVSALSLSPDGRAIASGSWDKTVRLWDCSTGRLLHRLDEHGDWIHALAFSPDGKTLASGGGDPSVRLWDVATGRLLHKLNGREDAVLSVAFAPDGRSLASGHRDGSVHLWDVETGRCLTTLNAHSHGVASVAFSRDGRTFASGSNDATICLWSVQDPCRGASPTGRENASRHRSEEEDDAVAQCNLGVAYQYGQGVPQDDTQAVAWYRMSAEQGNADAQWRLGWMYRNGRGVPQDDAQAVKWYRKSAEQGNANAQCNLGVMYDVGKGVPQDDAHAVSWYLKSAEQGHARAQFNLGLMYANGRGVPQSIAQAESWYRRAAAQGHERATAKLRK